MSKNIHVIINSLHTACKLAPIANYLLPGQTFRCHKNIQARNSKYRVIVLSDKHRFVTCRRYSAARPDGRLSG